METTHKLTKTYEGYPSKNKVLMNGSESDCLDELKHRLQEINRLGGDIIEENEESFVCANYDDNNSTVIFAVKELSELELHLNN